MLFEFRGDTASYSACFGFGEPFHLASGKVMSQASRTSDQAEMVSEHCLALDRA